MFFNCDLCIFALRKILSRFPLWCSSVYSVPLCFRDFSNTTGLYVIPAVTGTRIKSAFCPISAPQVHITFGVIPESSTTPLVTFEVKSRTVCINTTITCGAMPVSYTI
jgi:hypothetical protein